MSVDCLLDTNSIVKHYHTEDGSDVVNYLFDRCPDCIINLTNIQVAEVIKTLYKLRSQNIIKDDTIRDHFIHTFLKDIDDGTNNGRIKLYDFATYHLKDEDVYLPTVQIPLPKRFVWNYKKGRLVKQNKKRADTIDTLMLMIMRDIASHTTESYLVTSDEHVLLIAKSLNLPIIDPEQNNIPSLPPSLQTFREERIAKSLKVICKEHEGLKPLGRTGTKNISCKGFCIERRNLKLKESYVYDFTVTTHDTKNPKEIYQGIGMIMWIQKDRVGIQTEEPIQLN